MLLLSLCIKKRKIAHDLISIKAVTKNWHLTMIIPFQTSVYSWICQKAELKDTGLHIECTFICHTQNSTLLIGDINTITNIWYYTIAYNCPFQNY